MDKRRTGSGNHWGRVTGIERALAVGSILCGLVVAAALVVFCVHNLGFLALALVGTLMVTGVWEVAITWLQSRLVSQFQTVL